VFTGCSVHSKAAPLSLIVRTMGLQVTDGARQAIDPRVTTRVSPFCRKARTVASSVRPSVVVPLAFSSRMTPQPAAVRAATCSAVS
jgi:hypothetical protein